MNTLKEICISCILQEKINTVNLPDYLQNDIIQFVYRKCYVLPYKNKTYYKITEEYDLVAAFWFCHPEKFFIRNRNHSYTGHFWDWLCYLGDGEYYDCAKKVEFELKSPVAKSEITYHDLKIYGHFLEDNAENAKVLTLLRDKNCIIRKYNT